MRIEPWKAMAGLAGVLVIVGVIAGGTGWTAVDVVVGGFLVGTVLAATYAGWRMGKRLGS